MRVRLKDSAYSHHFLPLLKSKHRYLIAFGGRGSGKTEHILIKYLLELFQPYYFNLIYVNKEKANIRDQQYKAFKRVAKNIGLFNYLKFYDGDYRIVNPQNDNTLLPKGMDDPEKTKGIDDATAIWWDEINKGTLADFSALNELLRSPKAEYLQFAMSFNPVSSKHWLRTTFFESDFVLKEKYNGYLSHSTYLDNEFLSKQEYLDTLLLSANGRQSIIDVNVLGKWGVTDVDNRFYYAFDNDKHVAKQPLTADISKILYISFDFNVNPMTAIVGQHDFHRKQIRLIKEYRLKDSSVYDCCRAIRKDFANYRIMVTGDAAGHSRSAIASGSFNAYDIIKKELHINFSQTIAPLSNPYHSVSRNDGNGIFTSKDILICPNMEFLINDLNSVQANNDNGILKNKDSEIGHLMDCLRYYFNSFIK
jgi:PBSX family phage terminase large subunit